MKRRDFHQYVKTREKEHFFIQAKKDGYKARSAYKLIEMQKKFRLFCNGENSTVLDLGCAPGAWIQVIQELAPNAKIVAVDLLPICNIKNVNFMQGNIYSENVLNYVKNYKFNCILSDIAPNFSGNKHKDYIDCHNIISFIIENYLQFLTKNGNFCFKIFNNADLPDLIKSLKPKFDVVKFCKPEASNKDSAEIYILCLKFNGLI